MWTLGKSEPTVITGWTAALAEEFLKKQAYGFTLLYTEKLWQYICTGFCSSLGIRSVWFQTLCEEFQVAAGTDRLLIMSLFSMAFTESCLNLEHCCSWSRIWFRLLLALLSCVGHWNLLQTQLKYSLAILIFTCSSGSFQKQFKYKILKIQWC